MLEPLVYWAGAEALVACSNCADKAFWATALQLFIVEEYQQEEDGINHWDNP